MLIYFYFWFSIQGLATLLKEISLTDALQKIFQKSRGLAQFFAFVALKRQICSFSVKYFQTL